MKKLKIAVICAFVFAFAGFELMISNTVDAQTGSLTAPTGVIASNGSYANKIGLNWDPVRGATLYRIYRSTTDNPFTSNEIGSTAAPYFFDATPAQGTNYYYWLRAENGSIASILSSSALGLRAAGSPSGFPSLSPPPSAPPGNPVTGAKVALGKVLFWDEQLSSTRTVSCGTCHIFSSGGSDPRSIIGDPSSTNPGPDGIFGTGDDITGSPGIPLSNALGNYQWSSASGVHQQVTGRRSMTVINTAYIPSLFWDGRATSIFRDPITNAIILGNGGGLESQAVVPPMSSVEMAHVGRDWNQAALQIQNSKPLALASNVPQGLIDWIGNRSFPEMFAEAFGTADVTPSRIALAIATYERTLFSDRTPVDLLAGSSNQSVMTPSELRGQNIFNSTNCTTCHAGPLQTNNDFLYIGVRPVDEDLGHFTETGLPVHMGAFKVSGLRNVGLRTSFMHNGRFATLGQVLDFYNRGGDFDAPNKDSAMVPLGLNPIQLNDLIAFLGRPLTDPRVANETSPFDRPTLYTESNRVPITSGTGRAGAGGIVPQIVAIEPPLVGNPSFTIAVSNSLPGSEAVLVVDSADPGVALTIPSSGSFSRSSVILLNNGSGIGYGSISLNIPNDPALIDQTFYARWYSPDAAATNGFSVSPLVQFTIFGEAPNAATVTISGTVMTPSGSGIRSATVLLSVENGATYRVLTNSFGTYTFQDIPYGANCAIGVSAKRYLFDRRTFTLTGDLTNIDFVGQQ